MSDNAPDARSLALASAELIGAQVAPILEAIAQDQSGTVVERLQPRDEDYAKVFVGDAVDAARRAYTTAAKVRPGMDYPTAEQNELRIFVAPAGMLTYDNELSRHFPGGYRAIAHQLNPHRVWVAWKYVRPETGTGLAYDGLVWLDDHWSWFSKPYRALAPAPGGR